jgi:hypothetical protein
MRFGEQERLHKDRMTANVFAPIIREPAPDQHDCVRGKTASCEVGSTTCSDRLTSCVVWEV